ncbi:hypothetical protein [Rahnella inusitata]|uniref:hypothetical protein n=1 Tax=Rahnella inusitata TaxID=58169 RepID=UPI0017B3A53A|nr:hypothetical protein [Rahnella inusitata]NMC22743.1 hypothetical protein [Serratia sp. (in: enterobacteria)]QUT15243.1 hypothetical protein I2123_21815 [Rahnella inusitata]
MAQTIIRPLIPSFQLRLPTIYLCPVNKNADLLQFHSHGDLLNGIGCARGHGNGEIAGGGKGRKAASELKTDTEKEERKPEQRSDK